MEKDLLENFIVKINDLQKDIIKNYDKEIKNVVKISKEKNK